MITKIYTDSPDYRLLDKVAHHLRDGEIVIYPTGIGYAYGCSALKQRTIENICRLKGVDWRKHRMAVMCPNIGAISEYAKIDNQAFKYIKEHSEEPITYILPAKSELPKMLQNKNEIGIRLSLSPVTTLLLETLGVPLLTASLPPRHEDIEYLLHPELIDECYGDDVYTLLDGGIAPGGQTAIVRLQGGEVELIRPAQEALSF